MSVEAKREPPRISDPLVNPIALKLVEPVVEMFRQRAGFAGWWDGMSDFGRALTRQQLAVTIDRTLEEERYLFL